MGRDLWKIDENTTAIWTAVFAVRPRHPKLEHIIRQITKRVSEKFYPAEDGFPHRVHMFTGGGAFVELGSQVRTRVRADCEVEMHELYGRNKLLVYQVGEEKKNFNALFFVNETQRSLDDAQWTGPRAPELLSQHIVYCNEGPACPTI